MQHIIERDSMSSVQSAPRRESRLTSTAGSPAKQPSPHSRAAELRATRRALVQSGSLLSSKSDLKASLLSQSPVHLGINTWQPRSEHLGSTPELILKGENFNFIAVSKANLGSPSPPETDESDSEIELDDIEIVRRQHLSQKCCLADRGGSKYNIHLRVSG